MPPNANKPYRLKPAALLDLENIWLFTAERWSIDQANTYLAGLNSAFERIARDPNIARERMEYAPPVRIYRHSAHIVVFRELGDHIEIIRIRHGREDWMSDLAEDG